MITITTATNSYKLNDQRYQKGDLSVSYQDDGTVIIGNYHANVSDVTVDGQTFATTVLFDAYIADKLFKSGGGSGDGATKWSDITDKPTYIGAGSTAQEARTVIGAGTSNYAFPSGGTSAQFVLGDNTLLARTEIVPILTAFEFANPSNNFNPRFVSGNSLNRDVTTKVNQWTYSEITTSATLTLANFNYNATVTFNGTDLVITVPTNTVAIPIGACKEFVNRSPSTLTVVGANGVTVNGTGGLSKVVSNGAFKLWKTSATLWNLTGNLTA